MMEKKELLAGVGIVIPTYNAGKEFAALLQDLSCQTVQPQYRLVIDSNSVDDTTKIANEFGWTVKTILKEEFSHGGTRQQAVDILLKQNPSLEIVIFITQDVKMPQANSLEKLLAAFQQDDIGAAYGRQLPHIGASVYAAIDREFNYPPASCTKSMENASRLGIKTVFFSDSFAAYRVLALVESGGFPQIDICEDMYVAGKLLLNGYKTAYAAAATVRHSHEPSVIDMWRRYRAMGNFQKNNLWISKNFGKSDGEGVKLLKYQLQKIGKEKGLIGILWIIFLDVVRWLAFKI